MFSSLSGLSARHTVDIKNLIPASQYTFEIEAITNDGQLINKRAEFKTLSLPETTSMLLVKEEELSYGGIVMRLSVIGEEAVFLKKLPIKILSNTSGFKITAKDRTIFPGSIIKILGVSDNNPLDNFTEYEVHINKSILPNSAILVGIYFSNPSFPSNYTGDETPVFQIFVDRVKKDIYAIGDKTNAVVEISNNGFVSSIFKL
ncbi:hypothetical protein CO177_00850 [Candidatus Wolfebacteria bacterium CG_4_9_14_3_um_filter_37_9]|uniref:Uncharacterized protein n=1 Tax=Candidatus Wolfebacteria bacterium CG_4_9_14_3_um_filter_37_9 TaxID=1975065 RepID=A0A2M7X6E9_9BACT|nr:MAG: hypothetical protein CO177_00850 [Candidatus Wolfebacteria bacterium CG_4_9_14_3_um_filter_37_9]